MKNFLIVLSLLSGLVLIASCPDAEQTMNQITTTDSNYTVIGDSVDVESAMAVADFLTVIDSRKSMDVTFAGRILGATSAKMCIISIELGVEEDKMIVEAVLEGFRICGDHNGRCCPELFDNIGSEAIFKGNWGKYGNYQIKRLRVDGVAIKIN